MLGHPGISAFEYAGAAERHYREERAWAKAAEETVLKHANKGQSTSSADQGRESCAPQPVASSETSELQQPQTPADEFAQRRRGTFVNHTPRDHEVRLSSKLPHHPISEEEFGRLYASHRGSRGSSDDNTETSKSCSGGQHSSLGSCIAHSVKTSTNEPVELDGREIPLNPLIMHPVLTVPTVPIVSSRQRRSQSSSAAASIKSSQTGLSKRSLRTFLGRNASLDASFPRQPTSFEEPRPSTTAITTSLRPQAANSKRRRRQTPYKAPASLVTDSGRHAPLEPLVLRHRREVTGSDVDPLPPHVDIDNDISEAATLLALNEYFDRQEAPLPDGLSPLPLDTHLQKDETDLSSHPIAGKADAVQKGSSSDHQENTPNLPERNPERLSRVHTPVSPNPLKTVSSLSVQSDFTSAAKGQYSPYDERGDSVPKILHRKPVPTSSHERGLSTPSASGKLAPRIPGHEELASSRLHDFNYFLRMTGPTPMHETKAGTQKRKKTLKGMRVRSRREGKNPVVDRRAEEDHSQVPACCLEETTKAGGVKHLRIKIPGEDVTEHLASFSQSPPWTDDMTPSLERAEIERTIDPTDCNPSAPNTQGKGPHRADVSPKMMPVEHHPLLVSRKEQTRSRKLRDLKKAKSRTDEADAEGGAEENHEGDRVTRLEWLVSELTESLKMEAGIEGDLGPEEVLGVWKQRKEMAR